MTQKASTKNQNSFAPEHDRRSEPIAIIGIGCRFPGGADTPEKFWKLLVDQVDAIMETPADRVDVAPYYDPVLATPGKIATNQGGFLDKVAEFDSSFFGVSPREANYMDPQQRLLLETSWDALEDAGQVAENLNMSQTGVYIGMWANDYTEKMYKATEDINLYVTTGGGRYAASGRLSFFFGFQGPSLTLDTACSSSLVTVHLACQSLRAGESNLALAGGVNLILEPSVSIGYSRSKMLSQDGRCKFGDASANGYVRSEGVGIVVLKRLSDAIADNDSIYAVIRGSAVNNDGRSSELLVAPGVGSQIKMLREAYQNAGIDPARVGYVEAHGTGTPVGDPVELEALGAVLSINRDAAHACRIGSVKTNIGHTEAASGVAALIKTALCLKHRAIPASLHFKVPNPKIPWSELGLEMQTALTPWPFAGPAIAGVNSFGITGTNAHLVLEEAPHSRQESAAQKTVQTFLLPLSAQTPEALAALARAYVDLLSRENTPALDDLCYTTSCRRSHHAERLAVTGAGPRELAEQLSIFLEQKAQANEPASPVKIDPKAGVVFVFPGQGAQWFGMGRELLQHNAVFRETMQRCEKAFKAWTDWSLLEQLSLAEASPAYRLTEISVIQPVLFAMEIALAEVWRAWGVAPAAVIGHSMGEVAAAYIAGALSLDDAARVICKRSLFMQRTSGKGAMAVIGLPFEEAGSEIRLNGFEEKLSIAVQNSPRSTVVSGDPQALAALLEKLREREVFCRLINVDVASHSPQMDPLRPELVASLNGIQPHSATIPFYSTVTQEICDGDLLGAEYWGRNLRQPVRFSATVQQIVEKGAVIFIEMSPHPILLSSIEEICKEAGKPAHGFASLRRSQPELATMLGQLGSLYAFGYRVDWNKLYPDGGEVVPLPAYPWQRERFWFETTALVKQTRPGANPLLGQYLQSAAGAHIWETAVSTKLFSYLKDHRVRGSAVFPAAGYIEMVLAAAAEVYGSKPFVIKQMIFQEAFFVSSDDEQLLQLVISSDMADAAEFHFYSRATEQTGEHKAAAQTDGADAWTLHTSGKIELIQEAHPDKPVLLADLLEQQDLETGSEAFYQAAAARGLDYGDNFLSIEHISQGKGGVLAKIVLPGEVISRAEKYQLHPVLIDACLQALLFALPGSNQDTYLPSSLKKCQVFAAPDFSKALYCFVEPNTERSEITGELLLFNQDGQLVLSASGLSMQRLETKQTGIDDLFYQIEWQESPVLMGSNAQPEHWMIFADRQDVAKALAQHLQNNAHTCTLVFAGSEFQCTAPNVYEINPAKPEHFSQLLREVAQPLHELVHLWSLDEQSAPSIEDLNLLSILYLVQAAAGGELPVSPRLTLVTRGTQVVAAGEPAAAGQPAAADEPAAVQQSSVWGLGAVIANEMPNLRCTRVDLSPTLVEGEIELLAQTLQASGEEDQIALRNRLRYAARLAAVAPRMANETESAVQQINADHLPFQVEITEPGILDHLSLKPVLRKSPKAGEVEILVKATGLNFMNLMAALGLLPGYAGGAGPLGIECAGIIASVGAGVTEFQAGDEIAAIAFDSLASYAVTDARLVVKKPGFMGFEEAATIPIAYVTAYYALHDLGRMRAGERVLIHSATGGVGLAAVQLAQRAGAEIYATVGSAEKRAYLSKMGIQHVFDSRSLSFADEILRDTGGEGVDLILNSLAGSAILKGLEILRPYGRFLEIGKRDIYQNSKVGLLPFQQNLSYFAIDLDKMSRERPDIVGTMLREVFDILETGEITALPVEKFPVSKVRDAFRMMAQAKHIGKIVITLEDPDASFELPAGTTPIHADGTYLITGGLGDLGLTFAQWLARQGARHLVLVGRSKPSIAAQKTLDELRAAGVNAVTAQADVTDRDHLAGVLAQIAQTLPPLRGVIHAAGLLADGTLLQMDRERFELAFAPKVQGAWNLHTLTAGQPLDFFILFSSIAATFGTPGQANYAAGNAFLDGLSRYRRAKGLPALSINWGPWSEIGLANKQANRGERLMQQGLKSISPAQGIEAIAVAMAQKNPQISVVQLDASKWCAAQPAAARSSLFKNLLGQAAPETSAQKPRGKNIRDELLAVEAGRQRRASFDNLIREQVAQVLRMSPSRIPSDKSLKTLGLDSLMSIELRNRLEDALGVSLSATLIFNYPTVTALVPFLAEKMGIALDVQAQAVEEKEFEPVADELDQMDKDELEALLADELSAIDETLKGSGSGADTRTR